MTSQIPKKVTFKMRKGKQIEMAFTCLWFLFLSTFMIWMTFQSKDHWPLPSTLFLVFLNFIPIAGIVFYGSTIIRSRLTLSEDGLCFKGAFSSGRHVSWQDVKGFYKNSGEIDLKIERVDGKPEFGIPISWFAKMRLDQKPHPADPVMDRLLSFAPHLFHTETPPPLPVR